MQKEEINLIGAIIFMHLAGTDIFCLAMIIHNIHRNQAKMIHVYCIPLIFLKLKNLEVLE